MEGLRLKFPVNTLNVCIVPPVVTLEKNLQSLGTSRDTEELRQSLWVTHTHTHLHTHTHTIMPESTCKCLTGSSAWGWENMSQVFGPSAPRPPPQLRSLPPFSSPCPPTAAPPVRPSSSRSVRLTPPSLDSSLIGDESAYRWESDRLATWCSLNNLDLKTVEMVVDFGKNADPPPPPPPPRGPPPPPCRLSCYVGKADVSYL